MNNNLCFSGIIEGCSNLDVEIVDFICTVFFDFFLFSKIQRQSRGQLF
jgi:hypothetical protein